MHDDNICSLLKKVLLRIFCWKLNIMFYILSLYLNFTVKTTCVVTVWFIIQSIEIFKISQQTLQKIVTLYLTLGDVGFYLRVPYKETKIR